MKVTEHLDKANQTLISFEILPPLKGQGVQSIFDAIDPLMEFNPPFIDVTYHREEFVYKNKSGGLLEKQIVRKRPGTVGICAAIMNKYQVDAVPHIICGGFSREETENALIDLDFLGIDNVLLLRGDPIKSEGIFIPEKNGHVYAIDLLKQVTNMNNGVFLDEELPSTVKTNFCIGVAGYPEKHFEAPNFKMDLNHLKNKVESGAEYIVTQMFFDNSKYFEFVKRCREIGIEVPIIPGLKPITSLKQITSIPRTFHVDLPDDLVDNLSACKTNEDAKQAGIEWAIHQSKELINANVPCLHFYTMSRSGPVKKIVENLF